VNLLDENIPADQRDCTLIGNSSQATSGVDRSTLYNCIVSDNSGGSEGYNTFYNCRIIYNKGAPFQERFSTPSFTTTKGATMERKQL
jgi:hypothetical protein